MAMTRSSSCDGAAFFCSCEGPSSCAEAVRIIPKSETAAITAIKKKVRSTLSPVKIVIGRRDWAKIEFIRCVGHSPPKSASKDTPPWGYRFTLKLKAKLNLVNGRFVTDPSANQESLLRK